MTGRSVFSHVEGGAVEDFAFIVFIIFMTYYESAVPKVSIYFQQPFACSPLHKTESAGNRFRKFAHD
jgi:hypothetical protein